MTVLSLNKECSSLSYPVLSGWWTTTNSISRPLRGPFRGKHGFEPLGCAGVGKRRNDFLIRMTARQWRGG